MNVIEVTPDKDGRIFVELYGKSIEIHDNMFDKNGVAVLKGFGEEYEIHRPVVKKDKQAKEEE